MLRLAILELSRELMIIILDFCLFIPCFYLEALINHLLFKIFWNVLKNLSKFSSEPLFRMQFGKISCYLVLAIVFISSSFEIIGNK